MDHPKLIHEGARFLVAGSAASAVNWLVRLAVSFVVSFPVALVIGAISGMALGFVVYRTWVFPQSARRMHHQAAIFLLVNAVTAAFVITAALLIVHAIEGVAFPLRVKESFAHAVAIGLGAIISFIGHRQFTFARRPRANLEPP
jgi:putative flippase GtrA